MEAGAREAIRVDVNVVNTGEVREFIGGLVIMIAATPRTKRPVMRMPSA